MTLSGSILLALLSKCGGGVPTDTLASVVSVESSGNPFVIANVTDSKSYTFNSLEDAVLKAKSLSKENKNFSAGLMQVNSKNFSLYGLTPETVFNYCGNISAGAKILSECYSRTPESGDPKDRLKASLSCYYSGNFQRGLVAKGNEKISYVSNVINHSTTNQVPSISILKGEASNSVSSAISDNSDKSKSKSNFFVEGSGQDLSGLSDDEVVGDFVNSTSQNSNTEGDVKKDKVVDGKAVKKVGVWDIFKDY